MGRPWLLRHNTEAEKAFFALAWWRATPTHKINLCVHAASFTLTWTQEEANLSFFWNRQWAITCSTSQDPRWSKPDYLNYWEMTSVLQPAQTWDGMIWKSILKISECRIVGVSLSSAETLCNEMCEGMKTIWAIQFIFSTTLRLEWISGVVRKKLKEEKKQCRLRLRDLILKCVFMDSCNHKGDTVWASFPVTRLLNIYQQI